jgi:hypothetical protein
VTDELVCQLRVAQRCVRGRRRSKGEQPSLASADASKDLLPAAPPRVCLLPRGEFVACQSRRDPSQSDVAVEPAPGGVGDHRVGVVRHRGAAIELVDAPAVAFDSAGVRVPAIVAGPFGPRGVCKAPLDNTSILQMLAERFGTPGEAYSSSVAARAGTFGSVTSVLSVRAANGVVAAIPTRQGLSGLVPSGAGHQQLEAAFTTALKDMVSRHGSEALAKFPDLKKLRGNPALRIDSVREPFSPLLAT